MTKNLTIIHIKIFSEIFVIIIIKIVGLRCRYVLPLEVLFEVDRLNFHLLRYLPTSLQGVEGFAIYGLDRHAAEGGVVVLDCLEFRLVLDQVHEVF